MKKGEKLEFFEVTSWRFNPRIDSDVFSSPTTLLIAEEKAKEELKNREETIHIHKHTIKVEKLYKIGMQARKTKGIKKTCLAMGCKEKTSSEENPSGFCDYHLGISVGAKCEDDFNSVPKPDFVNCTTKEMITMLGKLWRLHGKMSYGTKGYEDLFEKFDTMIKDSAWDTKENRIGCNRPSEYLIKKQLARVMEDLK